MHSLRHFDGLYIWQRYAMKVNGGLSFCSSSFARHLVSCVIPPCGRTPLHLHITTRPVSLAIPPWIIDVSTTSPPATLNSGISRLCWVSQEPSVLTVPVTISNKAVQEEGKMQPDIKINCFPTTSLWFEPIFITSRDCPRQQMGFYQYERDQQIDKLISGYLSFKESS